MSTITLQELAANPAGLIERINAGECVTIEREGRPVAEVRPVAAAPRRTTPRPYGLAAGEFTVPDDFDAPLPDDILDAFEGR